MVNARPESDPKLLARLSRLELRARIAVEGLTGGRHASKIKGAGLNFAEHRPYVPGDDIRRLDWKIAARTDRHVVRVHEEESSLTGWLLVDTSASMGFGSTGWSKLDYATWTAASIARLLAMQNDQAGLLLSNGKDSHWLPARAGRTGWPALVRALEAAEPDGEGEPALIGESAVGRLGRRGLVVWLTDGLGDPSRIVRAASRLREEGHDVIVLRILDPVEINLDWETPSKFVGLEGEGILKVDPNAIRTAYIQTFEEHAQLLRRGLRELNVEFLRMPTDQHLEPALAKFLTKRAARLRKSGR